MSPMFTRWWHHWPEWASSWLISFFVTGNLATKWRVLPSYTLFFSYHHHYFYQKLSSLLLVQFVGWDILLVEWLTGCRLGSWNLICNGSRETVKQRLVTAATSCRHWKNYTNFLKKPSSTTTLYHCPLPSLLYKVSVLSVPDVRQSDITSHEWSCFWCVSSCFIRVDILVQFFTDFCIRYDWYYFRQFHLVLTAQCGSSLTF